VYEIVGTKALPLSVGEPTKTVFVGGTLGQGQSLCPYETPSDFWVLPSGELMPIIDAVYARLLYT
jgi:hypothetical protein